MIIDASSKTCRGSLSSEEDEIKRFNKVLRFSVRNKGSEFGASLRAATFLDLPIRAMDWVSVRSLMATPRLSVEKQ